MNTWGLAFRNVWRNTRRSLVTVLAIALSCAGLLLFGGYVVWGHRAGESHAVTISGHIQIFKHGYQEKGSGNPNAYALENFAEIRDLLLSDPILSPRLEVVTGQLSLQGIASSAEHSASTTFIGHGAFAEDVEKVTSWNPYGIVDFRTIQANRAFFADGTDLAADDPDGVTLGLGIGRVLGISRQSCLESPRPAIELLSVPSDGGLPNMLSFGVRKITARALESLDNHLIVMPIQAASDLLFPGEPIRATSILLLLKSTSDLSLAKARIQALAAEHRLEIEARDCWEMNPHHLRSLEMMDMFFGFAFCIIAVVLVFTIYNTVMMGVVERTREIGALRAIGFTRGNIRAMFTQEGLALGLMGGGGGIFLGLLIAWVINHVVEILYMPPQVNIYARLQVMCADSPALIAGSFFACLIIAVVAAFFPARRAGRMEIAEALRH